MFSNYFKIALRNFRRQPFFSGINVAGLGVGLAACWLIGLYVQHEYSYDHYLPESERICAVALDLKMGQEEGQTTNTPPPVGPRLAADFPEIELAARTFYLQESVVRREKPGQAPLVFNESGAYAADTAFLELFGFPMLEGDAATALDRPGSLVLSEAAAVRYFGDQSPMGMALSMNDRVFTVTGVVRALPTHSTVQFDFLAPTADFKVVDRFSWSWVWLQMDTWVRLREKPTPESLAALEAKFPAMILRHAPAAYERIGQNFEEQLKRGDRYALKLLPLPELHLGYPDINSRLRTLGDGKRVGWFAFIGVLILVLACVNFMNLSTARSAKRAREVGVRKSLGSQRSALVAQFMSESLWYSAAALLLAAGLAALLLPLFNRLTGLELQVANLYSGVPLGMALALMLMAALLGGLYPALFLSRFKPMETLKTSAGAAKGGHASVRSSLVVFQFAVSIALMITSWGVYRQLDFAQHNSPGLRRENVLVIPVLRNFGNPVALESFRQQIAQLSEVKEVTHSIFLPSIGSFGDFYEPEQGDQQRQVVQNLLLSSYLTDKHFIPTLGMEVIAGRNFEDDYSLADSTSVILNEAAVKAIGWEQPLGKWMRYPGNGNQRFQVVGVVRDFHLGSVRAPIEPAAIFHASSKTYRTWASYVSARLHPGTEKAAAQKVGALWASAVPTAPFDYDYLDASFARLYRAESQTGNVLGALTGLALFIGCLGLFALAAYTAEQRTKEIGIRKVLGASVTGVAGLLSRDFLKLVFFSFAIAAPAAYYAMEQWLSDYAYRIEMDWWMFALAGLASMAIAILTVSFQSIRAALANPVKSLRSE
jgi:putative ABC transport system permease protein